MKTLLATIFSLALALFFVLALPSAGEETVYADTLRLHVLAASDETADQNAKLLVRDAVLATYGDAFLSTKSKGEAEDYLVTHLDAIEETVKKTLDENRLDYTVAVTLTDEWFDTRTYGEITLPEGRYTALKITLGEGKGQNFWCMLYPALCVTPALGNKVTADAAYTDAAYTLVKNGYALRFRTLELLSSLIG